MGAWNMAWGYPDLVEGVLEQAEKRFKFSYDDTWPAAFLLDPINFRHTPAGWFPPFASLSVCEVDMGPDKLMSDAKEAFVRLAGGEAVREATLREFGRLRVEGVPADVSDVCQALNERTPLDDGGILLAPAHLRRKFWQGHMFQRFPNLTAAAGRLLSAHLTSCSCERNWSLFGHIFTKTTNRLALERARKIAFIRSNIKGAVGADEEIMLSHTDLEEGQ